MNTTQNYHYLFDYKKTAQSIAFFANQTQKPLSLSKLSNLLYLTERTFLKQHASTIIGDHFVLSNTGLRLQRTYLLLESIFNNTYQNNHLDFYDEITKWTEINNNIIQSKNISNISNKLLELSVADIKTLQEIWQQYGDYSDNELNQKIQDECPEYHYSQSQDDVVIPIEFILETLGYSKDVAAIIKQQLYEQAEIIKSFKDNIKIV
jgi:hypothetical protein